MRRWLVLAGYVLMLFCWLLGVLSVLAIGLAIVVVGSVFISMIYVPFVIQISSQYGMKLAILMSAALLTFSQACIFVYGMLEMISPSVKQAINEFAQDMRCSLGAGRNVVNGTSACAQGYGEGQADGDEHGQDT